MPQPTYEEMLQDPARYFETPEQIVRDQVLSRKEKILLLKSWAVDEERLEAAVGENMAGGESSRFDQVQRVLQQFENSVH